MLVVPIMDKFYFVISMMMLFTALNWRCLTGTVFSPLNPRGLSVVVVQFVAFDEFNQFAGIAWVGSVACFA